MYFVNTVYPLARKLHLGLSPFLPRDAGDELRVRSDYRWLTESDMAERWRVYTRALGAGAMRPSEVRQEEMLEPDEETRSAVLAEARPSE